MINLDVRKEFDLDYVNDIIVDALEDSVGINKSIVDDDIPNSRTFHLKSKPYDDVDTILHNQLKNDYPEIDDKIQFLIDKIDDTTINVKYKLNLDFEDLFNLIHWFIKDNYGVKEYDDFDNYIDYFCTDEYNEESISKDIYEYLATFGISDDEVQLEIDLYNLEFFNYCEFRIEINVKDDKYTKIIEYKRNLNYALKKHWNPFNAYTNPIWLDNKSNKFVFRLHFDLVGAYDKDRLDSDICEVLVKNHLTNNDAEYYLDFNTKELNNADEAKYGCKYYTSLIIRFEINNS